MRCSISAFSFSAHADYSQTSDFVSALAPPHVVLCHGNTAEMERLRKALVKQAATLKLDQEIHTPKARQPAVACPVPVNQSISACSFPAGETASACQSV